MQYETRPVADLKPYENNPRHHPAAQIDKLAQSIEQFGWTVPILIDPGGRIIAGHGRYEAALKLGLEDAPVIIAEDWTDDQMRAYTILDNRLAEASVWDSTILIDELQALLDAEDFDVIGAGLDDEFLSSLMPSFEPKLEPTSDNRKVTAEDVRAAADAPQVGTAPVEYVDIACPHCEEEFTVAKSQAAQWAK